MGQDAPARAACAGAPHRHNRVCLQADGHGGVQRVRGQLVLVHPPGGRKNAGRKAAVGRRALEATAAGSGTAASRAPAQRSSLWARHGLGNGDEEVVGLRGGRRGRRLASPARGGGVESKGSQDRRKSRSARRARSAPSATTANSSAPPSSTHLLVHGREGLQEDAGVRAGPQRPARRRGGGGGGWTGLGCTVLGTSPRLRLPPPRTGCGGLA